MSIFADEVTIVVQSTGPTDVRPRCLGDGKMGRCGKLLAEVVSRPWIIKCPRCHTVNEGSTRI